MRRLPSRNERAELDRVRSRRRRELLAQADQMRAEVAQLARACAALASGPAEEPRQERVDAQLARLEGARAALQIARLLIEGDDPEQLGELPELLHAALGRWRRASEGWWEARIVWRPRLTIGQDRATGTIRIDLVNLPFGPYFYRHWRQEGRQQTQYLGRDRPQGFPAEQEVPALPEPITLEPESTLGREALALADRLVARHNAEGDEDRRRQLRRLLRSAGRRVERRLRAERQGLSSRLSVDRGSVHTTEEPLVADALLAGASQDLLARIGELVQSLGGRALLDRESGQAAYDDLAEGFAELRRLIRRRAVLEELLRRRTIGVAAAQPGVEHHLAAALAAEPSEPIYRSLLERASAAIDALRSRGSARGAELRVWLNLALETRRELRRVGAQGDDLAARAFT